MRKTARMTPAVILLLLLLSAAGCGGTGGGKSGSADYAASRSVVESLAADRDLDGAAGNTIAAMLAGTVPLQQGMDAFSAQTRDLLALIEEVASAPRAKNGHLRDAQKRLETYLRERVFQIESTLGAGSPQEAQATYDAAKANLGKVRDDVRGMLFAYDPSLEKSVP